LLFMTLATSSIRSSRQARRARIFVREATIARHV
jgi:hypothetical protein